MRKFKSVFSLGSLFVAVSMVVFMSACHKTKADNEDTSYATDYSVAEKTFNDVQTVSDQAATMSTASGAFKGTATTGSGCAVITRSFNGTDSVVTVDFGTTNCLCHDGSYRRGQIIVTFSGSYSTVGSVHNITFNNFFHNDNQVTGKKTVTNMGLNSAGQQYYNVSVNCTIIRANGGGTHTATWTRVRTIISSGTPTVYQITGSGTLVRPNGKTVGVSITSPLVMSSDCRWIEAGTLVYSLPNGLTRTMNYGNTAVCDDAAVVTLPNGTVKTITLK